jgi:hypothetical protein
MKGILLINLAKQLNKVFPSILSLSVAALQYQYHMKASNIITNVSIDAFSSLLSEALWVKQQKESALSGIF